MNQSTRYRRRAILLILIVAIVCLSFRKDPFSIPTPRGPPTASEHGQFWTGFYNILKSSAPDCNSPTRVEDHPEAIGFKPDALDHIILPEHIKVEPEDKEKLKKAHSHFVDAVSVPNAPRLAYQPGSRGIVSTAGGAYLPVFVTSLHMLRKTGSTLPVEIFVADASEYDAFICGSLLPSLNARCIVLDDILAHSPLAEGLKKYQFKIFSLLFSSFEEVLFLDADAFPMHDPAHLFASEPFTSSGLITWPDFWQVTYHPSFFEVSSQELPSTFRYASTESGQLIVSKRSHAKMLLLSAYYNFYGPTHYYPLLSQGHPGEGDKETFIAPSLILGLPFYAVSTGPAVFGYKTADGGWEGGVIMQTSPIWDSKIPEGESFGWGGKPNAPPESFLTCHANLPKLDPISVFGEGGLAWDPEGKPRRMWGSAEEMIKRVGYDIERDLWGAVEATSCELEGKYEPWDNMPKLCDKIHKFITDMTADEK